MTENIWIVSRGSWFVVRTTAAAAASGLFLDLSEKTVIHIYMDVERISKIATTERCEHLFAN